MNLDFFLLPEIRNSTKRFVILHSISRFQQNTIRCLNQPIQAIGLMFDTRGEYNVIDHAIVGL